MRKFVVALAMALAGMTSITAPVSAQTADGMTAEEIALLFAKQKTRGLSLAPTTPEAATPEAVAPAAITTEGTSVVYAEIPVEEQVNININFDFDSAALREDQKPRLVALCDAMKAAEVDVFRIVGHTDSSGSAAYNQRLSLLRAEEVKRYLAGDCGIDPARLEAVGVGASFPYDEANPRGDVNRRVEFQALS
ncbi:MAG: OmpA family protein [Rhodobacteraceae bacterium]|nr:OmpA family protein [Paracoccaceae bacterium]